MISIHFRNKIITCMREAHSIEYCTIDVVPFPRTILTLFAIERLRSDARSSHAEAASGTQSKMVRDGHGRLSFNIVHRQSFDYGRKCTVLCWLRSAFASSIFCFYELLNAKPLFGLINLPNALRCCISVPSLHRSTSSSSTRYGMIIGFGLCIVESKAKTIYIDKFPSLNWVGLIRVPRLWFPSWFFPSPPSLCW